MKDSAVIRIAFGIDSPYVPHLAATIASIAAASPKAQFHFIILHDGVPGEIRLKLQRVAPDASFDWIEIEDEVLLALSGRAYISRATFYRLALPEILSPEIGRVLYLDSDLIVSRDIAPLWHADITGYPIAAVCDPGLDAVCFARTWGLSPEPGGYFNAGVLVLDLDRIRQEGLFRGAIDFLVANRAALEYMDQDALNYALWQRWFRLDAVWNVQRCMLLRGWDSFGATLPARPSRPAIIHYTGDQKPWLRGTYHPYALLYWRYLSCTPFWNEVNASAGMTLAKHLQLVARFGRHWPYLPRLSVAQRTRGALRRAAITVGSTLKGMKRQGMPSGS